MDNIRLFPEQEFYFALKTHLITEIKYATNVIYVVFKYVRYNVECRRLGL